MEQPHGFSKPGQEHLVCKLKRQYMVSNKDPMTGRPRWGKHIGRMVIRHQTLTHRFVSEERRANTPSMGHMEMTSLGVHRERNARLWKSFGNVGSQTKLEMGHSLVFRLRRILQQAVLLYRRRYISRKCWTTLTSRTYAHVTLPYLQESNWRSRRSRYQMKNEIS